MATKPGRPTAIKPGLILAIKPGPVIVIKPGPVIPTKAGLAMDISRDQQAFLPMGGKVPLVGVCETAERPHRTGILSRGMHEVTAKLRAWLRPGAIRRQHKAVRPVATTMTCRQWRPRWPVLGLSRGTQSLRQLSLSSPSFQPSRGPGSNRHLLAWLLSKFLISNGGQIPRISMQPRLCRCYHNHQNKSRTSLGRHRQRAAYPVSTRMNPMQCCNR